MAEIRDIELFNALHGHKNYRSKHLTGELLNYISKSLELALPFDKTIIYSRRSDFKRDSKAFMSSLYRLHKIGYLDDETIEDMLLNYNFYSMKDLAEYYNSLATFIDPYRLPIEYTNDTIDGLLYVQSISQEDNEDNLKLFRDLNVFFQKLQFGKKGTINFPLSLTHEITHTQLDSNKGIIRDFYNGEVLSIFNELLHAYNISYDLFLSNLTFKLKNIALECLKIYTLSVDDFDKATSFKYIYSTMKAIQLLELYINGNSGIKKEINSSIQSNFDGDSLVEDTLRKYDINLRSASRVNNVKRLIK